MVVFFWTLATLILVLALGQVGATVAYSRRIMQYVPVELRTEHLPQTLVIMSLRGGDESLLHCLDRLGKQDYPHYQLKLVIDHPSDPACAVVDRWLATKPPLAVRVEYLEDPSPRSTLKCSAIRQALRDLDCGIQAVVLIDSDVAPYPHWLRDMVSPLGLPGIGAVTGNRWYFPQRSSWGGWCRFIYNGLALPPMDWFHLAWAGSLAMRGELARSSDFLATLERSSSDESAVWNALQQRQLQLHFNPRTILWNSEPTEFRGCCQFIFRQLLWARLYHPAWTGILAHALGSYLLLATAFLCAVAGFGTVSLRLPAASLLGSIGLYLGAVLFSLGYVHRVVRLVVLPRQGHPRMGEITLGRLSMIAVSSPLTLVVYTLAILRARLATRVMWRGIEYRIRPPHGVEVAQYLPFGNPPTSTSQNSSLPSRVHERPTALRAVRGSS